MEKIKIQDNSGDRNYFTIIPNYILNHSTIWDREVYIQMKRIAGEEGTCWTSRNTLARQCGMSLDRLKKSIKYLLDHNWIEKLGTKKISTTGGVQEVNEYKIIDLWKLNTDFYINKYHKGGSLETPPINKGGSPNTQRGVVVDYKGGSLESHKEEPEENKNQLNKTQNNNILKIFEKEIQIPINEHKILLLEEKQKFLDYWSEKSTNGKRERWQLERVFDIKRRWARWLKNVEARMKPKVFEKEKPSLNRGGGMAPIGEFMGKYKSTRATQ